MEETNSEIFLRTCTKHEDIGSKHSPRVIKTHVKYKNEVHLARLFMSPWANLTVSAGRHWTRQSDWTRLHFCVSAVLLSTIILLFLSSSSVSLSFFNLAVLMRKCLGKHSCMSSPFSIAILNGTCSHRAPMLFCSDVPAIKQLNYILDSN